MEMSVRSFAIRIFTNLDHLPPAMARLVYANGRIGARRDQLASGTDPDLCLRYQ